jgi:hypothetical protein
MKVTSMARQSEVVQIVRSTMLLGNHVLNVMRKFAEGLVQLAILASLFSSLAYETPGSGIHR